MHPRRLEQITTPDGTAIGYSYDELNNLIGVRNIISGEAVRYGYSDKGLNLIAGDTGEAIAYYDTPQVLPVRDNLGTAREFIDNPLIQDSPDDSDLYTFSLRESEINSTATDFVYLGVDVEGIDTIPEIEGLTPVSTQTSGSSSWSLFAISKSGLNLLTPAQSRLS